MKRMNLWDKSSPKDRVVIMIPDTCIERNKRVRGGIQTFEYVCKRTRLKREKCVLLFFSSFPLEISLP